MKKRSITRKDLAPAKGAFISFDIPLTENSFDYEIVNLDGYVIKSRKNVNSSVIDVSSLMSGMYAIRVKSGDKQLTKKLIVDN
jgi:hypothetical protein